MYNLSGLYYQMVCGSFVFGFAGVLFLQSSRFWVVEKRNIKELLIGLFSSLLCICFVGYHVYVINNIEVAIHEGTFIEERRESPYLFRTEYCFSNEGGLKQLFYLDIFSKKKVYPTDFEKDMTYRIYYEDKTDVIIKVEKIE